jgi:hypothetical protein
MNDYEWHKEASKHLVGRTIKKVKWLDADSSYKLFGWDYQPCEIHLDDGTILTPSADDEGNNAGAIFTNIKDLQVLPVNREPVSEKTIQQEQQRIKNILDKKVVNE